MILPLVHAGIWLLVITAPAPATQSIVLHRFLPSAQSERYCNDLKMNYKMLAPEYKFTCVELRGA